MTALVKQLHVPAPCERAFELFTARMGQWWPLATHSVGAADAVDVTVQGRLGGDIVEQLRDGSTSVWGTITKWDPPHAVAFTWHPGREPREATHVEVRFTPHDHGTLLELIHTGWDARPDAAEARHNYDSGWTFVLSHLTPA